MPEAAGSDREPAASRGAGGIVERLRAVHLEMVDAVLGGDGLDRVAALASDAAGAPVAVVTPRLGAFAASPPAPESDAATLRRYVADRVKDRPAQVPPSVAAEVPIMSGDDVVGAVLMLTGPAQPNPEAGEFLHLAAVASLTEVAVEEAKEEVEQNLRGSFLEDLRSRPDLESRDIVRRAGRLGGDDAPERTLERARRLAERLRQHGTVGLSSFYADPAEFGRAIQEAELVLDVLRQSDAPIAQDIGTGTYRLLFRVLASHPEEVRSFYDDTVAPLVRDDDQYRTDLVGTLEAYLDQNCNMNATAAAIYAHRHTVAYRLERVKELTGLDPMLSEDRERLGLGLKAYRIIAPRLPK